MCVKSCVTIHSLSIPATTSFSIFHYSSHSHLVLILHSIIPESFISLHFLTSPHLTFHFIGFLFCTPFTILTLPFTLTSQLPNNPSILHSPLCKAHQPHPLPSFDDITLHNFITLLLHHHLHPICSLHFHYTKTCNRSFHLSLSLHSLILPRHIHSHYFRHSYCT